MNNIFSFYKLISNYKIEIPMIQRDYAQGRDNAKAKDVRKSIVTSVIKALNSTEKEDELFFDFVYGKVDEDVFIPFDGQQRLTTLFLIHLYVFEKCQIEKQCSHYKNCFSDSILSRFSYKTRQSSREFCEQIIVHKFIPPKGTVAENIKNQPWFFADWEKDPTIVGMLAMLDEIDTKFKNEIEFQKYAERLTSGCNCPITFHFVDMKEHKLTDTTYIKMNARGKSLTPFENFKASLEQYLESKSQKNLLERFKGKYDENEKKYSGIDGIWLDLFWKEQNGLPDNLMLSFFNRHFRNIWNNYYSNLTDTEKQEKELNNKIDSKEFSYPTSDTFISFKDVYEPLFEKCDVESCLTPIFNLLDNLVANKDEIKKNSNAVWDRENLTWDLFVGTKNNEKDETYPSRTIYYSLLNFYKNGNDIAQLGKWMRVVWNIVENYVEGQDSYISAIKMINDLSVNSITILSHLSTLTKDSFSVAKDQMEEEIFKAKLIWQNNQINKDWEDKIIEAESFAFFKGAIRFLFRNAEDIYTKDNFETKWENCKKYFDVKEEYKTESKLLRFFVSKCTKWEELKKIIYDNRPQTWKINLLSNNLVTVAHNFLCCETLSINNFASNLADENQKYAQNDLVNSTLLDKLKYNGNTVMDCQLRDDIHSKIALFPSGANSEQKKYVIADKRNAILSKLITDAKITSNQKIKDCDFFWGWDINFQYNNKNFQWNTDNKVYLMNGNDCQKNGEEYNKNLTGLMDDLITRINSLNSQPTPHP